MTGRIATMSMDGTPISQADIERIEEEERLHAEQKRKAARVIASSARDLDDCKMLLDILGLDSEVVRAARDERRAGRPTPPRRRSRAA
jgi:sRNA-binding protein